MQRVPSVVLDMRVADSHTESVERIRRLPNPTLREHEDASCFLLLPRMFLSFSSDFQFLSQKNNSKSLRGRHHTTSHERK